MRRTRARRARGAPYWIDGTIVHAGSPSTLRSLVLSMFAMFEILIFVPPSMTHSSNSWEIALYSRSSFRRFFDPWR